MWSTAEGWLNEPRQRESWFGAHFWRPLICVLGQSIDGIYDCQKRVIVKQTPCARDLWRRNPGKASALTHYVEQEV